MNWNTSVTRFISDKHQVFQWTASWMKWFLSRVLKIYSIVERIFPGLTWPQNFLTEYINQLELAQEIFLLSQVPFACRGSQIAKMLRFAEKEGLFTRQPSQGTREQTQTPLPEDEAHCSFDLHFLNNEQCWASFHVFVSHLYVFFGEMSI